MARVDYTERIPNNVSLAENRRLLRALEEWQPRYLDWWREMGPEGFQARDVYLRTAISVDPQGWAHFDWVKMPDYRWGIFLAEPERGRTIAFGDNKGAPAWQDVPGEYRSDLRNLITAEEAFFADSVKYVTYDTLLLKFRASSGVTSPTIVIGPGYSSATNTHTQLPGKVCGISVNTTNPSVTTAGEGEPACP